MNSTVKSSCPMFPLSLVRNLAWTRCCFLSNCIPTTQGYKSLVSVVSFLALGKMQWKFWNKDLEVLQLKHHSLMAQMVKNLPAMRETRFQSLGREDLLEKEMATQFSILAWRIPWTEEPGGLQSVGSERVRHDWSYLAHMHVCGTLADCWGFGSRAPERGQNQKDQCSGDIW